MISLFTEKLLQLDKSYSTSRKIFIAYLKIYQSTNPYFQHVDFLQQGRSPSFHNLSIKEYYDNSLDSYSEALSQYKSGVPIDFIVGAPSSRNYATAYVDKFSKSHPSAKLLTIHKLNGLQSSHPNTSSEMLFQDIVLEASSINLSIANRVLIVDDILNEGKTVSAIIRKLEENGLSQECDVCVAVPLVVPNKLVQFMPIKY